MALPPEKRIRAICATIDSQDLVAHMITFLPVLEATRLSVVSKRCKYSWHQSPKLDFGHEFAAGRRRSKIIEIINHVFLLHSRPKIEQFRLYFEPSAHETQVVEWLTLAANKDPDEIDLDFSWGKSTEITIPSRVLDLQLLKILKLNTCQLEPFIPLQGLRFLKTLILKNVVYAEYLVHPVLQTCAFLERLEICRSISISKIIIEDLKYFKALKVGDFNTMCLFSVSAPTLHEFYYAGKVSVDIFRQETPNLQDVVLDFEAEKTLIPRKIIRDMMPHFAFVAVLTISSTVLEALCAYVIDGVFQEYPIRLLNLKELTLVMKTTTFIGIDDIVGFLKCCPFLERFFIDFDQFTFSESIYWVFHGQRRVQEFDSALRLKSVKLMNFKFTSMDVFLVKFFLTKANLLERLIIQAPKSCNPIMFCHVRRSFVEDLRSFGPEVLAIRVNLQAIIQVVGPGREETEPIYPSQVMPWHC